MNIVLLGPAGAGKGTQAKLLEDAFGLVQLSTGDLFRAAVKAETVYGRAAKAAMEAGALVPDATVIGIVEARLDQGGLGNGVIFDGFPRTIGQAKALDALMEKRGSAIDGMIEIQADEDRLVMRLAGRFTCENCGEGYHETSKPTRAAGVCDKCGGQGFSRRADDGSETAIRARFAAYRAQTEPLVVYYAARGKHRPIDGMGTIPDVAASVADAARSLAH